MTTISEQDLERGHIISLLGLEIVDWLPPCKGIFCSLEELRHYKSLYLRSRTTNARMQGSPTPKFCDNSRSDGLPFPSVPPELPSTDRNCEQMIPQDSTVAAREAPAQNTRKDLSMKSPSPRTKPAPAPHTKDISSAAYCQFGVCPIISEHASSDLSRAKNECFESIAGSAATSCSRPISFSQDAELLTLPAKLDRDRLVSVLTCAFERIDSIRDTDQRMSLICKLIFWFRLEVPTYEHCKHLFDVRAFSGNLLLKKGPVTLLEFDSKTVEISTLGRFCKVWATAGVVGALFCTRTHNDGVTECLVHMFLDPCK
jgi:hypothetical protein